MGAGPDLPRLSGPPPPGSSLGCGLGVWSLGAGCSTGWASCGEGSGPGPGARARGQSGQEPPQPSGPAWPPPPAMQMPGVRVLLFRSQGEWGFPPWSPPALRFSLGLFLETFASVFVLCGAGAGHSQCPLGLAPQSGLGEGSPHPASPERAEGRTPREGPGGTTGCVVPAPGSMWSPGLGSGPGGEVWVWPMALPEGIFQNHSLNGARLKVRLRNSRPGHALTPNACVHTQHIPAHTCAHTCGGFTLLPRGPQTQGTRAACYPTPRARQPLPVAL